jgi:hypothetical protein
MWKYLRILGVLFVKLVDCGMIWSKDRGLFVKVAGISWFRIYFWMEKLDGLGSPIVDHWQRWSTVNCG